MTEPIARAEIWTNSPIWIDLRHILKHQLFSDIGADCWVTRDFDDGIHHWISARNDEGLSADRLITMMERVDHGGEFLFGFRPISKERLEDG